MTTEAKKPKRGSCLLRFLAGLIGASFLFYIFILPIAAEKAEVSNLVSNARDLGLAFFQYAQDNNGHYPTGKSSTEIFQKLLDGGYLTTDSDSGERLDLAVLYYPMPGKVRAALGTKVLKPENVCWDVTCCMDGQSPNQLPKLFLTGYQITYQTGASAIPLPHPLRNWSNWWHGKDYPTFIVVNYVGNNSTCIKASPDGTIPNFIPADFDPKGKTYHQLTPDGELPP